MFRKVKALLTLTRPPNGILMFIAVLAGVTLSNRQTMTPMQMILSFITAYGLNGSIMGFNDYFDRDIDRVNAPWRPIPSGAISCFEAIFFSAILGSIGIISATLTSTSCLIVAVIAYLLAFTYNMFLKQLGLIGNMAVSGVVVAPFIYGAVLSDGYVSTRLTFFAIPVYLSVLGREIIKGISDVEGDALKGIRSIARTKGKRFAGMLGGALYIAAVSVSPFPYILDLVSWPYIVIVLLADIGFIYSAISIVKNPSRAEALKVKKMSLLWMLIALIAFIMGSIT
ncbi:MAG: hypothetical protein DRN49_04435 [Thaumarchaeota archaeon]|nr:MAG: hypothetical protein DRN49_04435 [Nitrososphaerota archaeon]